MAPAVVGLSGLAGLASFDGTPIHPRAIEAMVAAAPHRSVKGVLAWTAEGAAFAYQRRSVLAARTDEQGLATSDELICVADARLDNRQELIAALVGRHALDPTIGETMSEAEVILASYREWNEGCARRLVGDFAFAVWDSSLRRLYAARDPLAMRSLAYHVRPGRQVAVATEVKQLLTVPDVPLRLYEPAVLADLLGNFGRPEWSFYEGVANLEPGHFLLVDRHGHRTERFWAPEPADRLWLEHETNYADLLRERFVDAVAARLRTSRPAGILLSGGMDSGSVASTAGWLVGHDAVPAPSLHAFCWAYDRLPQCDERAVSRLITEGFGMEQTDVEADSAGPLSGYPAHGPDRDDPFLGAFQPLIERSLAAARSAGIGVMLGGDRGDLVLGNTGWSYLRFAQAGRWRELRNELTEHRRVTADSWGRIAHRHLFQAVIGRIRRRSPLEWLRWAAHPRPANSPESMRPEWLRPSPALDEAGAAATRRQEGFGAARGSRLDWIFTQQHIRGMAWSERTYARFGLAFADPFSDRRVVEFALAVPQVVINRPGDYRKPLMRAAMRGVMPEEARRRAAKVLPTPLYEQALRYDAHKTVQHLLSNPRVAAEGWVDAEAWRQHYQAWCSGSGALRAEWWHTLSVEIWLRQHWA